MMNLMTNIESSTIDASNGPPPVTLSLKNGHLRKDIKNSILVVNSFVPKLFRQFWKKCIKSPLTF